MLTDTKAVLKVRDLRISFHTPKGNINIVRGINLDLRKGEVLGIVGESGCGKSLTSQALMGLLPDNARIGENSSITVDGKNLTNINEKEWEKIRGKKISMIFQDPMTSLNPSMKIGEQIAETIRNNDKCSRKEAFVRALEMLKKVRISSPELRMKEYPYQLSGGMKQRVMIAIALSSHPEILIADEPTTALDVTTQAQIVDLLNELKEEFNTSIIIITHDMGVVANVSDRIAVMYCGKVVEYGKTRDVLINPKHPYTIGLIRSIIDPAKNTTKLYSIKGNVPTAFEADMTEGCLFSSRCPYCNENCLRNQPCRVSLGNSYVECNRLKESSEKNNEYISATATSA